MSHFFRQECRLQCYELTSVCSKNLFLLLLMLVFTQMQLTADSCQSKLSVHESPIIFVLNHGNNTKRLLSRVKTKTFRAALYDLT